MVGADKIIGIDLNPERKGLAEKFGMTHFIDASKMGTGPSALKNGQIGMLYGMPVLHSTVMGSSASTGVEVGYIFDPIVFQK